MYAHSRQEAALAQDGNRCEVKPSLPGVDDAASECSTDCSEQGGVESLILFDWDDTLFPTSWIQQQGLMQARSINEMQKAHLKQLAQVVSRTLDMAVQIGNVVIVTNAEKGWVESSCEAFMPSLLDSLQGISIVSARSTYEPHGVHEPSEWKRRAFTREVESFYGDRTEQQRNIVSLGDSLHEQSALAFVTQGAENCCGKSLKFMERPHIDQLIYQHQFLSECFLDVVEHHGDLDVEISPENLQ